MLHLLDDCDDRVATRDAVIAGLDDHLRSAIASRGLGDAGQVAHAEAEVATDPARAIRFDASGAATVTAAGRSYQGGRFEVLRLCELRARALAARARAGRPSAPRRLWICDGASPATDIGALQAAAAPGSMFQVASQFNVNGRSLGAELPFAELRAAARARGGDLLRFDRTGAAFAGD